MTFAIVELNPQLIQLLLQVLLIIDPFSLRFHGDGWHILHLALLFHPSEHPG